MIIATHGGGFHLDDVVAVSILKLLYPEAEIIRTRDPAVLEQADIRVDVGKEYNPAGATYDHHQHGGAGTRPNGTEYAAAGLIWNHFGHLLCPGTEAQKLVDEKLIQFVDRIDNGEKTHPSGTYTLYELVRSYTNEVEIRGASHDDAFNEATSTMVRVVANEIATANAQATYNEKLRDLLPEYQGKPYVLLEQDTSLWQPVLVNETNKSYAIYPNADGTWRVRCVPPEVDGFALRHPLPEQWRGKSNGDLVEASGIEDALFCHKTGFIASIATKEGAIAFAEKAYQYQ